MNAGCDLILLLWYCQSKELNFQYFSLMPTKTIVSVQQYSLEYLIITRT